MQHLNDRHAGSADLVPSGNRPAGEIVADHDVRPLQRQHGAYVAAHALVVAVEQVPAHAREAAGALLGVVPVEVVQTRTVDPHVLLHLLLQAGIRSGCQHGHVATAPLQTFGQLAQHHFGAAADMWRIEGVEKKDLHRFETR